MKYKVKNTVTGEETIGEKVVSCGEDYYILPNDVEKEEPPCYCYNSIKNTWNEDIILYQGSMPMYHFVGFKKIIATTNKSLDLPMVIDEVEELVSDLENDLDKVAFSHSDKFYSVGHFRLGYNKAKETYSYTKEDLINFKQQAPLILEQLNGASDSELFDIWQEQRIIKILVK